MTDELMVDSGQAQSLRSINHQLKTINQHEALLTTQSSGHAE